MENSKKYESEDKNNAVNEPALEYGKEIEVVQTNDREAEMKILLDNFLAIALKQSEMGLGFTTEEVKDEIKERFNLPL